MKKKIILICSLVVMCLCVFAISASASNYYDISDLDMSNLYTCTSGVYSLFSDCESCQYVSTLGYDLSYFFVDYFDNSGNLFHSTLGLSNCENWRNYINSHRITTYDEFYLSFDKGLLLGYWSEDVTFYQYMGTGGGLYTRDIWNLYQSWLAQQNAPTFDDGYSQGKIDGVTEFKTTEEYKSQYTNGYTAGITYFKTSDEYAETLELERQIGQAEGKNNYLSSEEYKAALNKEYNNGYDTATTEQKQEQTKESWGIILGTCGIVVLALLVVYFLTSRKKRKRR